MANYEDTRRTGRGSYEQRGGYEQDDERDRRRRHGGAYGAHEEREHPGGIGGRREADHEGGHLGRGYSGMSGRYEDDHSRYGGGRHDHDDEHLDGQGGADRRRGWFGYRSGGGESRDEHGRGGMFGDGQDGRHEREDYGPARFGHRGRYGSESLGGTGSPSRPYGNPQYGNTRYGNTRYGNTQGPGQYGAGMMADTGMQRGTMGGKGPKGYMRSDDRIKEDVCDCLTDDHHLDASSVEVQVKSGEVTLTGAVETRDAKRHAEDLAERVSGVKHVQNNLRIQEAADASKRAGAAAPATRTT